MSRCRSQIGSDKSADFKRLGFKPRPLPNTAKSFFATLLLHFVSHFLILDPGSPGKGFPAPYQYQWNENWTVLRLNNKQQFEGGENVTPIDATRAWRSRWRGRHINDSSDKKIKQRGRQINYILNEFHLTRSRLSGNFQDTESPSWAGCEFFPMKGVDGRDFRASPKFQWGVGFRHWNRTDQLFLHPLSFFSLRIFSKGWKKDLEIFYFWAILFPLSILNSEGTFTSLCFHTHGFDPVTFHNPKIT